VRAPLNPSLKEQRSPGRQRLGRVLVVVQLAISMVLVIGATLFVGTLANLYAVDPGFDSKGVLIVNVGSGRTHTPERSAALRVELLERLDALPQVQSASAASIVPGG